MITDIRDRSRGILIGLAAGDRNGGPLRMATLLAESLASQREFDIEDVFGRYLTWWRSGGFDTGPISANVLRLVSSGIPRRDAVARVHATSGGLTGGCNPAHRSPPLAMAGFLSDDQIPNLARQEAALTHQDPLAGDVAAATVVLCRSLVRGRDWAIALGQGVTGRQEQTQAAFRGRIEAPLYKGGFACEVLQATLFFVSANDGFAAALEAALKFAGPANYCPVLVGAIAGARWGAANIPTAMVTHCDILPRVQTVAEALAESWE